MVLMLILSIVFGDSVGGLGVAFLIVVLLTFSHQSYYIVQQSNAIEYAQDQEYALMLLLGERMTQEFGAMVALAITTHLWNDMFSNGVLVFSAVWSAATLFMFSILTIYKEN